LPVISSVSLAKKTIDKLFVQIIAVTTQAILRLVTLIVFFRFLTHSDFGIIAISNVIMVFAIQYSQFGIGSAIVQIKKLYIEFISTAFFITLSLGFLFYLLLFFFIAPFATTFFHEPELTSVIRVTCIAFLFELIGSIPRSLLQRDLRFKLIMVSDVVSYLIGYIIIGISLALYGYGVWAIVIAINVTSFLKSAILFYLSSFSIKTVFSKEAFKSLMHFGGGITLARIFNYVGQNGDKMLIGRLLSIEVMGLYERASQVAIIFSSYAGKIFDYVLFPIISSVQNDKKRISTAYLKLVELSNLLIIPMSIIFIILSREIIIILLGQSWLDANIPLKILFICLSFRFVIRISDCFVRSVGAVYQSALRKVIFSVCMIFGTIIGSKYGLIGVSLGVLLSFIINTVMMVFLCLHILELKLWHFIGVYKHGLIAGIITSMVAYPSKTILKGLLQGETILLFVFTIFISITIILITAVLCPKLLGKNAILIILQISEKFKMRKSILQRFEKAYQSS